MRIQIISRALLSLISLLVAVDLTAEAAFLLLDDSI